MAESKLVDNVILTLVARLAIVAATTVGLPGAFWMMNRAVNSVDAISKKIDRVRDKAIETNGTDQAVAAIADSRPSNSHRSRVAHSWG